MATEDSEDAFSGQTVPLDIEESEKVRKTVVSNSRKKFTTSRVEVEKQMEALFNGEPAEEKKHIVTAQRKAAKASPESKLRGL